MMASTNLDDPPLCNEKSLDTRLCYSNITFEILLATTKHDSANINCQKPKIADTITAICLAKAFPREKALMVLYSEFDCENRLFEGVANTISHRGKLVSYKFI